MGDDVDDEHETVLNLQISGKASFSNVQFGREVGRIVDDDQIEYDTPLVEFTVTKSGKLWMTDCIFWGERDWIDPNIGCHLDLLRVCFKRGDRNGMITAKTKRCILTCYP